jgi:leucine-rich repeat protein SHOC2
LFSLFLYLILLQGFCDALIQLNVSGNKDLMSLPATLRNLSKLTQISVDESIRYPPPSIARKGSDGIRDFYARFDGLVPYGTLDLSRLHLESIPHDAVDASSLGNIILSHNPLGLHQTPLRNVELLCAVVCLELAYCDLQSLPAELSQLSCLQRLNLQNNMLSAVDSCILQLTAMVNLNMSGNMLRSITGLFSALCEIVVCDLSSNKIVFFDDDFQGASRLQSLNISKNTVEAFPASVGCLSSLQSLSANHCRISVIPASFMLLSQLHELNLDGNLIALLPPWLAHLYSKMPPLKTLSLHENPLDPAFRVCADSGTVEALMSRLQAPLLSHMDRFQAAIKDVVQQPKESCLDFYMRFVGAVGTAFGSKLDLTNFGFVEFPQPCAGYSDVTHVTLDSNSLGELPHHVSKLTRLVSLSARAASVAHVHDSVARCTTLTSLSLSYNNLATLPPSLGLMSSLVVLDLSNNKSIGFVAVTAMFQLPYVKTLGFSHCNLTQLPTDFVGCRRLTSLDVSNNNLISIPATVGFCRQLAVFDFSTNSVSQIPESLGMCTNLATLKLAANMVKDIPPHVGLLTNLTVLDISHNPMQPVLTAMFDVCGMSLGLTFLRQIYYALKNLKRGDEVGESEASDSAQEDIALQKLLEGGGCAEMDLSGFKLQAWPPQLCPTSSVCVLHRIAHVVTLNLSSNELSEVSEYVSCLANLKHLNLARNKIVSIHSAMAALTQLISLDISRNRLTQV